jgi:hypothetical protein
MNSKKLFLIISSILMNNAINCADKPFGTDKRSSTLPSPTDGAWRKTPRAPITAADLREEIEHDKRKQSLGATGAGAGSAGVRALDETKLPTVYKGSHPDIADQHGTYRPGLFDPWYFPSVYANLVEGKEVEIRDIEKAASEVYRHPSLFKSGEVAVLAQKVKERKAGIALRYWGDLFGACKRNKEEACQVALNKLREAADIIKKAKLGEKAALDGYGDVHGTGRTSPLADYGIGPDYEDEVKSLQQLVAKLHSLDTAKRALTEKATEEAEA